MPVEKIVNVIVPELKARGYKKNRLTWYKMKSKLSVVFSIQKSQYSSDVWYYIFGINLNDLSPNNKSASSCQIQYGIENTIQNVPLSADSIVKLIDKWESMYGDLNHLRRYAVENNLPRQTTLTAIRYLTSVDISRL